MRAMETREKNIVIGVIRKNKALQITPLALKNNLFKVLQNRIQMDDFPRTYSNGRFPQSKKTSGTSS